MTDTQRGHMTQPQSFGDYKYGRFHLEVTPQSKVTFDLLDLENIKHEFNGRI